MPADAGPGATMSKVNELLDKLVRWDGTLVAFGVSIGLIVGLGIGWLWWPVEWQVEVTEGGVSEQVYIHNVADLFAYTHDQERLRRDMGYWAGGLVACQMLRETQDDALRARLWMVLVVMGEGCQQ